MKRFRSSQQASTPEHTSPVTRQFKSPVCRTSKAQSPVITEVSEQVEELRKSLQQTESEIKELLAAGCDERELQTHIDKLHEYNEIKDVGQIILGRLANLEGLQTKDMYERYGLELND
ncbi:DNA repair protein SWI5 homolog [Physella acuta]|uniref:DNA repair protein SWI5 homolog n=1 Tax=Physella acuta TaxID=109671 RepID=UPI0027DD797F|nr:DNA repair protein SWI5 homolog [Physella acuta]XP_059162652.1 DNA repair protein SWI5 homolog [Physella acuta]